MNLHLHPTPQAATARRPPSDRNGCATIPNGGRRAVAAWGGAGPGPNSSYTAKCALAVALLAIISSTAAAAESAPAATPAHFRPLAVYVEAKDAPLAAYQVEVIAHGAEIVGVEGGEHPAFHNPPYYDPAALQGGRIILAAFNTGEDLPTGRTRVATLHMHETGAAEYEIKIMTAAAPNGHPIAAVASLDGGKEGQTP